MMERMFADPPAVAVDENRARSGNFLAKSTAVDGAVEKKRNDPSTACGQLRSRLPFGRRREEGAAAPLVLRAARPEDDGEERPVGAVPVVVRHGRDGSNVTRWSFDQFGGSIGYAHVAVK
jgi:hypothetical protein